MIAQEARVTMSGERSTNSDLPTQIQSKTPSSTDPQTDGTLVVEHAPGVKSASSMKVSMADAPSESHLSLIGKVIGPYRIRAELGAGGMGAVYLSDQLEPVRRQVALKVIKAGMDSEDVISRFQSERELLALMNHPNIAQVLDVGATPEGRLYFAMEYVPGVPVNEFCDRRGMDIAHRLELFLQICEGVQHAHQKGVIHRDLKPTNLMVADYQGQMLVKVIDFGIAKSMDGGRGQTGSTRMGVPIGTPAYMSPEQAAGDLAAIDTRTDVYSLGVVLYRLITHELPISGDTIARAIDSDLARVLREAHIRPPSKKVLEIAKDTKVSQSEWKRSMAGDAQSLSRALSGDLDWITLKALERDRDQRYSSVSELAADIRRHLQGEAVLAGPPSKIYRARKFIARNKLMVGAAAAVVLSLILGIIATSYMTIEASRQRARAEAALVEAQLQRDRAAEESARAIATRSFLEEMIAAPDPWKLEGGSPETRNVRVVDALAAAATNLDKSLADNPALRGEIATMLGRTLRRLGQLNASRAQLESAVQLLRPIYPENELPRLQAEIQLAITLGELGEFESADKTMVRLLPLLDSTPGLPADVIIDARRTAAAAANGVGDGARAEQIARDSLRVAEKVSGQETATSGAQAALADILGEQGKWEEAERLINEAYTNEQLRHGRSHPVVVQLLSLVANLAYRKGDYTVAEARYRDAANLAELSLGARHPETLRFRAHAVLALADGGAFEAALPEFRAQIPIRAEVIGADHPDVLTMRSNYANALRAAGQEDAAETEIEDVFRRRRATLGDAHPDTLSAINVLGVIARQRKDFAKAEVLFRQASELYLKAKGPMHPESVMTQANYLASVRDLGRIDEAVAGFSELHKRAEQVFPADHWFLAVIRGHLGLSYMEAKRYAEAEPMLKQSYQVVQKQFGDDDGRSKAFRARLAELYKRWGKPAEAASYAG
ncbi:MAG: serine/threonine-protein kinase [Pseudomonadota bacterium]|nr:serine/threonine-protein kinase [Pseudomonadota bacterium]